MSVISALLSKILRRLRLQKAQKLLYYSADKCIKTLQISQDKISAINVKPLLQGATDAKFNTISNNNNNCQCSYLSTNTPSTMIVTELYKNYSKPCTGRRK